MTWTNQTKATTPAPSNQSKSTYGTDATWGNTPDGATWETAEGTWASPIIIANQPRNNTPTITNQTKN